MNADLGLVAAIQLAVFQSPLAVDLDLSPELGPRAIEPTIASLVLEAVSNAVEHAHATKLRVKIWIEKERIFTEIEDNGIGGATGLRKLRSRAHAARGTIEIDSPAGVGTLVRAEIPLSNGSNSSR